MARIFVALMCCLAVGCIDDNGKAEKPGDEANAPLSPADAAPTMESVLEKPTAGSHLDGDEAYQPRIPVATKSITGGLELVLRSTPSGALASVDGKPVGTTPTFWTGLSDRRQHEFTFVKKGHAMARYVFIPLQSGVVHGTLVPLAKQPELDAGVH